MKHHAEDDSDEVDAPEIDEPVRRKKRRRSKDSRTYIHEECGGRTQISGVEFDHITDPFWICTGTYCCECEKNVSLAAVYWKDTRETVADYRRRMRRCTPTFLKVWHYGVGPVFGSFLGGAIGLAIAINTVARTQPVWYYILMGALGGVGALWVLGKFFFNRLFGVDYRTMR